MLSKLAGVSLFEPVSLPTLAVADPGMVSMDQELEIDADGDGLPWDDHRSWAWQGCTLQECTQDFTQDFTTLTLAPPSSSRPSGLFLDGNGNGFGGEE